MAVEAGWVENGYDDDDSDQEYVFRAPWHWRLRVWIYNDLARLKVWENK